MSESYAITVHPGAPISVHESLGNFIQSDPRILSWWNHLPNVYLVTTEYDAGELTALVKPAVKPWPFLVMKVDLEDAQGWLPNQAWDWIQRRYA